MKVRFEAEGEEEAAVLLGWLSRVPQSAIVTPTIRRARVSEHQNETPAQDGEGADVGEPVGDETPEEDPTVPGYEGALSDLKDGGPAQPRPEEGALAQMSPGEQPSPVTNADTEE